VHLLITHEPEAAACIVEDVMNRALYTKASCIAFSLAALALGVVAVSRFSALASALPNQPSQLNVSQTGPAIPTGASARRTGPLNVHIVWASTGANTKRFYLFHVASPGVPPDDWRSGGWQNDSIVAVSQRQADLPVPAVKPPLHNYYLVCPGNNAGDYSCSGVFGETASTVHVAPAH
jgi:hypothetical protein